jgi:uncharacterized phage protein (TIGR02218 family)
MKTVPSALAAHLSGGVTTLCHCWKLIRQGLPTLGFTDHDRAITFEGVVFEAESGFEASAVESALGLAVSNQDVAGALSSAAIAESDLAAGRFDGAEVEIWRVNWADTSQRLLLAKGDIGEVRRGPLGFTAELRGKAHRLTAVTARHFQFSCDADLGDARCGVDLTATTYRGSGAVTVAGQREISVSGLSAYAVDWFTGGRLTWTSGANQGLSGAVRSSAPSGIGLWEAAAMPVVVGDTFAVTAGCDKRFTTCKAKYANGLNFRGMPAMPGNDWVMASPRDGEQHDGGRLTT